MKKEPCYFCKVLTGIRLFIPLWEKPDEYPVCNHCSTNFAFKRNALQIEISEIKEFNLVGY